MDHGPIPEASTRADIRRIQDGMHLGHREMIDQREVGFLGGNRQDPAALFQTGWHAILYKFHEGFDGREARVPCPSAIAPLGLEMGEKGHDQYRIEMLQTEVRRPQAQTLAGEGEQQLKRIGVALTSLITGATLKG